LRNRGYEVFAVNPTAKEVDGSPCYPSVKDLPNPVDCAVIVTRSRVTERVVRDCVEAGIPRVWMHDNPLFGEKHSSASEAAAAYGREHGLMVIEAGCPLMFLDFAHKCMHLVLRAMNKLPN
jgi:predicted CoA-binding protein